MPVDSMEIPFESDQPHVMRAYTPDGGAYRPEPVPFVPGEVWTVGWDGSYIRGVPDQYRFEIRYRDGRRTVISRVADPIPVRPEERRAHRRRVTELLRDVDPRWSWDGPEIPETKPWYDAIIPDRSGRIWVLREGEGRPTEDWMEPDDWRGWRDEPEWVSELWFDVFEEASGRYLGRVDAPAGLLPEPEPVIDGNMFIGLTTDDLGRPILRRYRLEFPDKPALG
jgi:hypothetical protein